MGLGPYNEIQNIKNITYNAQIRKTFMEFGIGEIMPQGCIWNVYTWVMDNVFVPAFISNFENRDHHIGGVVILISLRIWRKITSDGRK